MINVHVTHHAGTTFCGVMKNVLPTAFHDNTTVPQFACMGPKPTSNKQVANAMIHPWDNTHTTATSNIRLIRSMFHMVSWEYGQHPKPSLQVTDWENSQLLSVYIGRDPMSRMLADSAKSNRYFPNLFIYKNATADDLWEFAYHDYTDNYNLHVLTDYDPKQCCFDDETNTTNIKHYETAIDLLQRFTIILDQDCLNKGIAAVADLLGMEIPANVLRDAKSHDTPRERIGNDDVYEYLAHKNEMDIKVYKWVQENSLIDCSEIV